MSAPDEFTAKIEGLVAARGAALAAAPAPAPSAADAARGITVALRSRPPLAHEAAVAGTQLTISASVTQPEFACVTVGSGGHVHVHAEARRMGVPVPEGGLTTKKFALHSAYGPECTDDDLYASLIVPLVEAAAKGGSGCCIAYGQTGSGKTYVT